MSIEVSQLPSIYQDVDISCAPIYVRKGAQGILPVEMTREVNWDSVTWTVKDRSNTELLKLSCGDECEGSQKMFSFKVEVAGVLEYLVQIKKDGELLECRSVLFNLGMIRLGFYQLNLAVGVQANIGPNSHCARFV